MAPLHLLPFSPGLPQGAAQNPLVFPVIPSIVRNLMETATAEGL